MFFKHNQKKYISLYLISPIYHLNNYVCNDVA